MWDCVQQRKMAQPASCALPLSDLPSQHSCVRLLLLCVPAAPQQVRSPLQRASACCCSACQYAVLIAIFLRSGTCVVRCTLSRTHRPPYSSTTAPQVRPTPASCWRTGVRSYRTPNHLAASLILHRHGCHATQATAKASRAIRLPCVLRLMHMCRRPSRDAPSECDMRESTWACSLSRVRRAGMRHTHTVVSELAANLSSYPPQLKHAATACC